MTYEKTLATNRQAHFNFFILEKIEAGVVLEGTEVKALRIGLCNLKDAYARSDNGELWLYQCHIGEYSHGNRENHPPLRPRKLLLHRRQILKLDQSIAHGGLSVIPLRVYLKGNRIKVELGLAKGKKAHDKRASIKEKDLKREAQAALRDRQR
jgi:SsrA-binding protein